MTLFKMSKKSPKFLFQMLKASIFLSCFCLFGSLMLETWDDFSKEMTTMGVKLVKDATNGPYLPCITVCPWKAFRKSGFFYKAQDYDDSSFNFSEIFSTK